ncbi:TspO/MBR family protein [Lysobacter humi (ex Lee et al. 2017)]
MDTPAPRHRIAGLAGWIALCYATAAIGALASIDAASFYADLRRPPWAPPAAVFGPVWTVLYGLMAVAAWRVWRRAGFTAARVALGLFVAQLVVNALWSWLFFGWRLGGPALADIVLLDVLVVATIAAFARIDRAAALLLVPYLLWISYATALNAAVWRLNPDLLG